MSDIPTGLPFVEPEAAFDTLNFVLYGPPGQGKTVGALSAPGPVLLLNAEGPGGVRYARHRYGNAKVHEVTFEGKPTIDAVLQHLRSGKADERTVVVDTLGEMYAHLLRQVGGVDPKIQHYGKVNTILEDFVRALRDLPFNVVIVCHEHVEDSEEGGALRRPLTGGRALPEKVMAMVDIVAYCSVLPGDDKTEPRYVAQLVQAKGRRAKDRSGALGAFRDLDLTEWLMVIVNALSGEPVPWDENFTPEEPDADAELPEEEPEQQTLGVDAKAA